MLDNAYYSTCSAARIAELVNAREVSAVEVMHSALGRLDEHEPTLRAFRSWWPETALREAGQIDRRIAGGERLPLAGVPLAVKAVEPLDSAQPARLRAAGCIPLGATAVPGRGTPWRTWGHTDRGPTENPWVPGRTPGGSSAGSAVAVAARIVPLATGIDGAGSIRIPAAWCGVIGLKTTNGLLGTRDRTGLAAPGPLCHDPGDAVLYLDALLGASPADPNAGPGTDPRPTRVGWSADLGFATVDAEQRAVARAALDRLIGAGLTERPCSPELRDPATAWTAVRTGNRQPAAHPVRAHNGRRLAQLFEVLDLLASPTTPGPPHPHSGPGPRINATLTWVFNLSGHPALSLPAGHDTQGRPVGLHLVARHGDERRLLTIATHYQRVSTESFSPPLLPGR